MSTFKLADQPSAIVHEFLEDAKALREEKDDLATRIAANRDILRNLRTSGKADKAQAEAIAAFYKDRESKSDTDAAAAAPAADKPKKKN